MTSFTRRISDTLLRFYLANELGPEDRARVADVLAASPADSERMKELRAAAEAFRQQSPAERRVARLREEAPRSFTDPEREMQELRERSALLEALVLPPGVEAIVLMLPDTELIRTRGTTALLEQEDWVLEIPQEWRELLTPRELQFVTCFLEGWDNRSIAEQLACAVGTVKKYLQRLLDKTGLESRSALRRAVIDRARSKLRGGPTQAS
jgi:DNA-binding CsgD family transcriptional regulator